MVVPYKSGRYEPWLTTKWLDFRASIRPRRRSYVPPGSDECRASSSVIASRLKTDSYSLGLLFSVKNVSPIRASEISITTPSTFVSAVGIAWQICSRFMYSYRGGISKCLVEGGEYLVLNALYLDRTVHVSHTAGRLESCLETVGFFQEPLEPVGVESPDGRLTEPLIRRLAGRAFQFVVSVRRSGA